MSDFGGLRSLLHRCEPSQDAFDALVAMCREASDQGEVERVWVPYALEHIASWPDDTRSLTLGHADADAGGGPWVALARVLEVVLFGWSARATRELFGSERFRDVTSLVVSHAAFSDELFRGLAASPDLRRLQSLRGSGVQPDAGLELFFERGLALEVLELRSCTVGRASCHALARSTTMLTLRELTLHGCGIEDLGAERLAMARAPRLTRLDLSSNDLSERAAFALARAREQPLFESLALSRNAIGDDGLAALARSGRLDRCRELRLCKAGIGDEGVVALASVPDVSTMRVLDLSENDIHRKGALAIAARTWPNLAELDLHSNGIDDCGLIGLLRAEGFEELARLALYWNDAGEDPSEGSSFREDESNPWVPYRSTGSFELNLEACGLGSDAVVALAQTRRLETVTSLSLNENLLTLEAATALGSAHHLPSFTELLVGSCGLGDDGLVALLSASASGRFAQLERLALDTNQLTDASASVLAGAGLVRLRELFVMNNLIGEAWVDRFVECPAFASIEELWLCRNPLGDAGLIRLAQAPHSSLETLGVQEVQATEAGLIALVTGRVMEGVRSLWIEGNAWTDAVTFALAGSSTCGALETIDVDEWYWSEEALTALITSPNLRSLEWVDADQNEALGALLRRLRDEGAWLNPWGEEMLSRNL